MGGVFRGIVMANPLDLFDRFSQGYTPTPARARDMDDDTSHEAAEWMNRSGKAARHCDLVLSALRDTPNSTAGEIGQLTELGHVEAQRRLSDLLKARRVVKGAKRRCSVKQTNMVMWRLV